MATTTRSTEDIRRDIHDQLLWDSRVDSSNIEIEVQDGNVRLSGSVPTYPQRRQAEIDTFAVPGIGSVDNRLNVMRPTAYARPSDEELQLHVENSLAWNASVDTSGMQVSTHDGVVTLSGKVNTYGEKLAAEHIAGTVAGVTAVKNEVSVSPVSPPVADERIHDNIIAALQRSVDMHANQVNVDVDNGFVTLTGTVTDYMTYRMIEDAARYTSGVLAVQNSLDIRSTRR